MFLNVEADLSKGRLAIEHFAYDDVTLTDTDDCETKPSSALPEPNAVCTFEDGACGWTQEPPEGDEHYHFRRVNGAQVDAENLAGPEHDYENNAEGFFMNADANGTKSHGDVALVYSSYFNGSVYPRECLHFYYSLEVSRQSHHDGVAFLYVFLLFQHDRAVETVLVETLNRDEPLAKVAWAMDIPEGSQENLWNLGTVPLEAADYQDYMVRFAVVRGSTTNGYFAFDNIVFVPTAHCEVYPPQAKPPDILGTGNLCKVFDLLSTNSFRTL